MYVGLQVKFSYLCPILAKVRLFWQICVKIPYTKLHENPSSGSWIVPCGQTDRPTDRQAGWRDKANSRFSKFFSENALKRGLREIWISHSGFDENSNFMGYHALSVDEWLDSEDGDSNLLRNVNNYLQIRTASHLRRLESSRHPFLKPVDHDIGILNM